VEALESRRLLSASPFSGPIQVSPGAPLDAIAGEEVISGTLATVTGVDTSWFYVDPENLSTNYAVRWGDGSAPNISFTDLGARPGELEALVPMGGHVYGRAGDYVMHVAFLWQGRAVAHVREVVHVDQNSDNGLTLHAFVGQPISAVIGTYTYSGSYTISAADVFWGDSPGPAPKVVQSPPFNLHPEWGSHSAAALGPLGAGVYQASGTHTYLHPGEYRVRLGVYLFPPNNQRTRPPVTILPRDDSVILSELPEIFSTIIVTKAAKPHAVGS
jgi:hypothetical protein